MTAHPFWFAVFSLVLVGALWSLVNQLRWAHKVYIGFPPFAWWYCRAIRDALIADAVIGFSALCVLLALSAP